MWIKTVADRAEYAITTRYKRSTIILCWIIFWWNIAGMVGGSIARMSDVSAEVQRCEPPRRRIEYLTPGFMVGCWLWNYQGGQHGKGKED